jgi:hypothetical protein
MKHQLKSGGVHNALPDLTRALPVFSASVSDAEFHG